MLSAFVRRLEDMIQRPLEHYDEMFAVRPPRGVPHHTYMWMKNAILKRVKRLLHEEHRLGMARVEVTSSHSPASLVVIVTGLEAVLRPIAMEKLIRSILVYDENGVSMFNVGPRICTLLSYNAESPDAFLNDLRRNPRLPARIRQSLRLFWTDCMCWAPTGAFNASAVENIRGEGVKLSRPFIDGTPFFTARRIGVADLGRMETGRSSVVTYSTAEKDALVAAIRATGQSVTLCTDPAGVPCMVFGQDDYRVDDQMRDEMERAILSVTTMDNVAQAPVLTGGRAMPLAAMEMVPLVVRSTKLSALRVFHSVVESMRRDYPLASECRLLVRSSFDIVRFREATYDAAMDSLEQAIGNEDVAGLVRSYMAADRQ